MFSLPTVGDGIKYKDTSHKSLGYKVIKGEKSTTLMLKKRYPWEQNDLLNKINLLR
jgi:hypothetical protein